MKPKRRSDRNAVWLVLLLTVFVACSESKDEEPSLDISPVQLDFGLTQDALGLEVKNTGDGTLHWQADPEQPWILPDPVHGRTAKGPSTLTVAVDRTGLDPGFHTGNLTVTSNAGTKVVSVSVRAPGPVLEVEPLTLDFGLEDVQEELAVRNTGTESLRWSVEYETDWIQLQPPEGDLSPEESMSVVVEIRRTGLLQGSHEVRFTLGSEGGTKEVTVRCEVPGPVLAVAPLALDFGQVLSEQPVTVSNAGGGKLSWSTQPEEAWIQIDPEAGETIASQTALVRIDRSALEPGTHSANVLVLSDGGTQSISVSAQVPAWSSLYLMPDLTLSPDPGPAGSLSQKMLPQGEVDWVRDLGGARATGTDYFLSLQGASYENRDLEVSLVLEHDGEEIPIVSTTLLIDSASFRPYEALLSGPAPESLPEGGRLILRAASEGPVWIRMGGTDATASSIRVPFP